MGTRENGKKDGCYTFIYFLNTLTNHFLLSILDNKYFLAT